MKKITQILVTYIAVLALLLVPLVSVSAQSGDDDPIVVDGELLLPDSNSTSSETTEEVAGIPDTGFGPEDNPAMTNLAVFIGGSVIGGMLGLGLIVLHRKYSKQTNQ